MRITFTVTDNDGHTYEGAAELKPSDRPIATPNSPQEEAQAEQKGLPERIIALRDGGFFREPRTPNEVHTKLLEGYHCALNRVQMALLRLQRRRELRKATKRVGDQECAAYVW